LGLPIAIRDRFIFRGAGLAKSSLENIASITESHDVVALLDKVPLTPVEMAAPKVTAAVTGATSFVGSHVVRRLLRAGHTVHAPVRDMDESFVGYLKAMPGAKERLKLFKVTSLVDPGAYDEAIKGCEVLHHVASPFWSAQRRSRQSSASRTFWRAAPRHPP
jgi:nucleoside-diphosphate-sugar epimerase